MPITHLHILFNPKFFLLFKVVITISANQHCFNIFNHPCMGSASGNICCFAFTVLFMPDPLLVGGEQGSTIKMLLTIFFYFIAHSSDFILSLVHALVFLLVTFKRYFIVATQNHCFFLIHCYKYFLIWFGLVFYIRLLF